MHKGIRGKKIAVLFLALLMLSGCRGRLMPEEAESRRNAAEGNGPAAEKSDSADRLSDWLFIGGIPKRGDVPDDAGEESRENPEADRKEFDEQAPAEILAGTDRLIHAEGEEDGAYRDPEDGEKAEHAVKAGEDGTETASMTVQTEEAESLGTAENAEEAESALTYYTVLLSERASSLFECKRLNVYWETREDRVTVYRTSPEHRLILGAGAYDVSSRLLEENLRVDDGWVLRKNPELIVKTVGRAALGSGTVSSDQAERICASLLARPEWERLNAVQSGRVLLISEEMLDAPYLQTAAMLLIAKTANPSLYEDVDPDQALTALIQEATGLQPSGRYYYQP